MSSRRGRARLRRRDESGSNVNWQDLWLALLVAGGAAVAGATSWFGWWMPFALALGGAALVGGARWAAWVVRRDARAVVALWLVFALNRSVGLLAPGGLERAFLVLDDVVLAAALALVLISRPHAARGGQGLQWFWVGIGVFAASGVVGALLGDVDPRGAVLGTWLALKLPVCIFVASQFPWRPKDIRLLARVAGALLVVVLVTAAVQLAFPGVVAQVFGARQRTRLGGDVITSIFREPAQYSTFMVFAVAVLLARFPLTAGRGAAVLASAAAALYSLRLKAVVGVVLLVAARVATSPVKLFRLAAPVALLTGGALAAYLGSGLLSARIGVLFGDDGASPRQLLYRTADRIADNHLVTGDGFGSFGSEASITWYSDTYARYGLADLYGFSERAPVYVHDASWATVLGEAGWLGAAGVGVALAALLARLWRQASEQADGAAGDISRAALFCAIAFVSDSVTSPQLFSGFACMSLAALVSLAARPIQQEGKVPAAATSLPAWSGSRRAAGLPVADTVPGGAG
jgi:hypothetical protein